ncbi:hypothetical protein PFISCL1PPCAC_28069, partial [Pristionchus fissidentatus]
QQQQNLQQQQQLQQQAALAASQLLSNSGVLSAAALYPQLMCFGGGLLEKIVRSSQMATGAATGFKPLPAMESVKPLPTAEQFPAFLIDPAYGFVPPPEDLTPSRDVKLEEPDEIPMEPSYQHQPVPAGIPIHVKQEVMDEDDVNAQLNNKTTVKQEAGEQMNGNARNDFPRSVRPEDVLQESPPDLTPEEIDNSDERIVAAPSLDAAPPELVPEMPVEYVLNSIRNPQKDTRTDLSRYKLREPRDWTAQDVVSWMLDTSRRMQIPFEDVNMTKFAGLPGITLMNSTEADWIANDPIYGRTFFREFNDLISGRANTVGDRALEEYMRKLREEELQHPSTSFLAPNSHMQQPMTPAALEALDQVKMRMSQANTLASTLSAALSPSMGLNSLHASLSPQSPLLIQSLHQNKQLSPLTSTELLMSKYSLGHHLGGPASALGHNSHANDYDSDSDDSALHGVNDKIRKNKDGKPRKRSQHSKGNKLWEFIRDALKDPVTCPSIVRWEDPHEGVFRIVESERLARLWGERKNNQKMTYEKLSRAMRTYYEKQILVPVPKTGLYPKKLVYKFGPGALGWENCRALAGIAPKQLV